MVVAVPHNEAGAVLPEGAIADQDRLSELGTSAIVDVHLVFDRRVTRWPVMAGCRSPVRVQVFDRTRTSGLETRLSVAGPNTWPSRLSAADELHVGRRPDDPVLRISGPRLKLDCSPAVAGAQVLDSLVTKERQATFRGRPRYGIAGAPSRRPGGPAWPWREHGPTPDGRRPWKGRCEAVGPQQTPLCPTTDAI